MNGIVVIFLIVVGIAWGVLTLVVRQKRSKGGVEARAALGGDDRVIVFDDKATSRGTESGPFNHLVGMGPLGFNGDVVRFSRWSPPGELTIPKDDIVSVEFTVEHLGKEYKAPLLRLRYKNPDYTEGETPGEDVVAFEVSDPDAWNDALTK